MLEMLGMQEMLTWPSTELMQLSTGSRSPSCPATLLVSATPPGPAPALLPGARKLLLRPTRRGVLAEPGAGAGAGRSRMMSGPRARLRHLTNQG